MCVAQNVAHSPSKYLRQTYVNIIIDIVELRLAFRSAAPWCCPVPDLRSNVLPSTSKVGVNKMNTISSFVERMYEKLSPESFSGVFSDI